NIKTGVSVDQLIAAKVGGETPFPSLELGCESGKQAGDCDSGYGCVYTNNISWRTPEAPATKEINPAAVFRRLFGGPDRELPPDVAAARRRDRRSVLDFVLEDAKSLAGKLGSTDRRKLDDYLVSVREVEARVEKAAASASNLPPDVKPPLAPADD